MAIADDFSIDSSGNIRYTGAAHGVADAGYYTVLEFYRWIQSLADNPSASGDDLHYIATPVAASKDYDTIINLINGYNIDDTASEHLYGGSITQDDGDTIYDGYVNYGTEGIHIVIIQNGAILSNDFWNTIPDGETEKGLNRDVSAGISHQFMIKTRSGGSDIDGRRLIAYNREFNYTYSERTLPSSVRGTNVITLSHSLDSNNTTEEATVGGWTTISVTEGYSLLDVNGDGVDESYYCEFTKDIYTRAQLIEYIKYLVRRGTAETLFGLDAGLFRGVTHEINIDNPTGTFSSVEPVSWSGGTGQMLAINSTTAGTKMWIQLLTGVIPTDGQTITGGTSGATADVNVTVTERTITIGGTAPLVYTGSSISGSYGFGITPTDLTAQDKLIDLTNTEITPPNYVTFSLSNLVASEYTILIGPNDGTGEIQVDQLSASGAYAGGETSFIVQEIIPSDTPSAGTIRVWDGTVFSKVTYTGWSGSTFTGCSNVPACSDGDNVWISYLDKLAEASSESFVSVYSSDRLLVIYVRDGGSTPIKPYYNTGTLTSSNTNVSVNVTPD